MNQPFVPIPMRMFAFETEFFATNDELLVFYYIGTLVSARNPLVAHLNIELLHAMMLLDTTNPSRGKKRIKSAIDSLHSKGYVELSYRESTLKNDTLLEITVLELEHQIYKERVFSRGSSYAGYTAVTDDLFSCATSVLVLRALIYHDWRSKIDYDISFSEWASILGVSRQTAINVINECTTSGLLSKHRGDYYTEPSGEIRQKTNKYYRKPTAPERSPQKDKNTRLQSSASEKESREKRQHNWFTEKFVNVDDMIVYLTTDCSVLKTHAGKRIKAISNSLSGKQRMDSLLSKAQITISNEKQITLVYNAINESAMQDMYNHSDNYEEVYRRSRQKQSNKNEDFSYLLGND
ncbi:hypothetical protein ACK8P5_00450 [Paenibacillus sp. EC2-1]|uniref:hypothetical protein n=1 Tax=Paenibacillus sp. EC2-1 TaxID=3388665 RepID=UPI003BEF154F